MADKGDPAAENALGLRYFQGDEKATEFRRTRRSASAGSAAPPSMAACPRPTKLGFLYWSGRGRPQDLNQAYFWTVLARARGDEGNQRPGAIAIAA